MKTPLSFLLIILLNCCSSSPVAQEYLNSLSESDFIALQREPLSSKYSQVQAVKVIYDLKTKEIYYISNSFQYHNKFCQTVLGYNEPLGIFNRDNYGTDRDKRQYLLANINFFSSRKEYILELSPSDQMLISDITLLHNRVAETSFLTPDVKLILNSARLINSESKLTIPFIKPEEIYKNQNFQSVSKFTGKGKLRKIELSELSNSSIDEDDIILINGTPLQLAGVSGIITTDLQTPLSHLSILGQNRKIPVMALKDAWDDENINSLIGKQIELTVSIDGFTISETNGLSNSKKERKRLYLKKNLNEKELIKAKDFNRKTANYCGYKAENFGILYQLAKKMDFSVPEAAFGIPFYYYQQHAEKSEVIGLIAQLENHSNPKELLSTIREKIKSTPVDSTLILNIENQLEGMSSFNRFRFRSSTNAEDMKGFSGAGLYSSKTALTGSAIVEKDEGKTIENALRKVWASLWKDSAYDERAYFNIQQEDVMMGILVHRSFPDEEVNGVAISKNLYRENNLGFVVNAQLGDSSVVQPNPAITCDQFICYPTQESGFYTQNQTIEIITTSSLNDFNLVMTSDEIYRLANVIQGIKKYFYYRDFTSATFNEYALDFEFKLEKDSRELYLKQVRPFN
ncbi:MAG: PEP/pyruvate-binding domain-containing protein [Flavobacteriales bacterium]